jgi:GTP diphosphokinase / guanosine-3',5'-bis(diphosphate) 3'-diphosphatase
MNPEALLTALPYTSLNDQRLVERAFEKAQMMHTGQTRKSGEPFFTHCVAVAQILADMKLDAEAIAAALMHDLIEDTDVTYDELAEEFNEDVAKLVMGVTKLTQLPLRVNEDGARGKNEDKYERELEYFRKMMLMMADDVRVVLIKLADRLHNMRTLGYMKPEKQIEKARETLEIFAPLANRLGIWQFKWELEDLAFRYLESEAYRMIASELDERRADREAYLTKIVAILKDELMAAGIDEVTITGRPKHIYSIYLKMMRKDVAFHKVYDVRAVRVIVDTIPQCYLALGVSHNLWRPIPGEFDDYIASPKDNFYRSLHTAVLDNEGKTIEVQIRTWEMHEHAEYGVAAHWRYKEGRGSDEDFDRRISYLRRLMEFGVDDSEDARTFMDNMKTEVFEDRVYAFTPKGDIIDLPVGSTAIDFAYHVHTEIGNRCRGAKVQGKLVSLNQPLKTGDQVEIQTAKRGGPSLDWLNPDLGYVKTNRARSKIRHWFRRQNRDKNMGAGRTVVDQALKRLGFTDAITLDQVAGLFDYTDTDDFFAAIGAGDINAAQISGRVIDHERKARQQDEKPTKPAARKASSALKIRPASDANGIHVLGDGGFLVNLAKCCTPVVGDNIIGYITRGRGVTVHQHDCPNISNHEPERLIEVTWAHVDEKHCYAVPVEIVAYDREGLVRDISTAIADNGINMSAVNVSTRHDIATFQVTMELTDLHQLTKVLGKIECIPSVVEAHRKHSG